MRGVTGKSSFLRDLWRSPRVADLISNIVGTPLVPHPMDMEASCAVLVPVCVLCVCVCVFSCEIQVGNCTISRRLVRHRDFNSPTPLPLFLHAGGPHQCPGNGRRACLLVAPRQPAAGHHHVRWILVGHLHDAMEATFDLFPPGIRLCAPLFCSSTIAC